MTRDHPWLDALAARVRELEEALRAAKVGIRAVYEAGWDDVRRYVAQAAIEQIESALTPEEPKQPCETFTRPVIAGGPSCASCDHPLSAHLPHYGCYCNCPEEPNP